MDDSVRVDQSAVVVMDSWRRRSSTDVSTDADYYHGRDRKGSGDSAGAGSEVDDPMLPVARIILTTEEGGGRVVLARGFGLLAAEQVVPAPDPASSASD